MDLSEEDVKRVAALARLDLSDAELVTQTRNLNELVSHFEILLQMPLGGVEPTSHTVPMVNVMREDFVRAHLSQDAVLAMAPDARYGCFMVPRILGS